MPQFEEINPSTENYWRAVILFGRNVASYKFALGQALIDLSAAGSNFIRMDELARPFALSLARHLKDAPKQTTSASSKFLDACRKFGSGEVEEARLIEETVRLGFNNVVDAFHMVNSADVPVRFFIDKRKEKPGGIELTDTFFRMREAVQYTNLPGEIEARWRLVETAWELNLPSRMLLTYDDASGMLTLPHGLSRRLNVTACRDALNGYQKGKCFYCFADIAIESRTADLADVDHFVPRMLQLHLRKLVLDGVWNLVLACRRCNRGVDGKSARIPVLTLLERLHKRNEFLIRSHHPLRETLINQTGRAESERVAFLNSVFNEARAHLITTWEPTLRGQVSF